MFHGLIIFATTVALGIVAWHLVERFAPDRAAGLKTDLLNIVAALPVFGADLVRLLTEYNVQAYISNEHLVYYFGAVILLNIYARRRTSGPAKLLGTRR